MCLLEFFSREDLIHHWLHLLLLVTWLAQKRQNSGDHSFILSAWALRSVVIVCACKQLRSSIIVDANRFHPLFEQGSPDLKAAREVADFLGTVHHEFHFTVQVISTYLS